MATFSKMEKNEYGLYNCQKGFFDGQEYTFSHFNPKTNEVYSDDIPFNDSYGRWVPNDSVTWS